MSITDPLIGKKLGDYTIEGILGTGGMARVYQGYDENLDRHAAIKVIEPQLIASVEEDEYRERFLREARAIARLNHSNIVSIYQFNQIGNLYYIAMEYAAGDNLRDILKGYIRAGRIMPTSELMAVLVDIADALDYAHQQGIIHRDVKPSNIIVTEAQGGVLTDFGLALNAMEGTIGNTFGSVHYIAPEQAISSAQAVPQSDQYSLGIVAYELLTGRVPFDDASAMSVALKHISDPPPPPTELNPNIPAEVEQVLMRVLDKDPDKRFATAKEFVGAMELAFNMLDNIDIEAPATLTEAVGAPPETNAFPPGSGTDSIDSVPEASRPNAELQSGNSATGRNFFMIGVLIVIIVLLGGYLLFTGIVAQNEQSTELAVALLLQENQTATQAEIFVNETDESLTQVAVQVAQQTSVAATGFADATATESANQQATARAIDEVNNTATQSSIETETVLIAIQTSDAATQIANDTATFAAIVAENDRATAEAVISLTQSFESTQTAIAEQASPTNSPSSTAMPTMTATQMPSNTPTMTATQIPSNTPTITPSSTLRPTLTPTPDFFILDEADTRQILLRYDGRSLIISNRDVLQPLNLRDLRFYLFEPDDEGNIQQTEIFLIDNSELEDVATNMIPERCLQLLDAREYSALPSPNLLADGLCTARPFWLSTSNIFWLNASPEAYFEVRLGPVDVIGICEVQRPLTRSEKRCAVDIHFP